MTAERPGAQQSPAQPRALRVLHLTSSFPRSAGDHVAPFLLDLARAQQSAGLEVAVLAPHDAGARRTEDLDGVGVHRFRYATDRWERLSYRGGLLGRSRTPAGLALVPVFFAGFTVSTLRLARRFRPDVLHAHWWLPAGLCALLASRLLGLPLVVTLHGTDVHLLRSRLLRRVGLGVLRRAALVAVVSEDLHRLAVESLGLPPEQVVVLRMPVTRVADPAPPPAGTPVRLVAAGRLSVEKGFDVLLEAVSLAVQDGLDVHLDLVGSGPEHGPARAARGPPRRARADDPRAAAGRPVGAHGRRPGARRPQPPRGARPGRARGDRAGQAGHREPGRRSAGGRLRRRGRAARRAGGPPGARRRAAQAAARPADRGRAGAPRTGGRRRSAPHGVRAPAHAQVRAPGPTARRTALVVLLLVGLSLAVLWFAGEWSQLREGARQLSAGYVVSAFLSVLASLWLAMLSWRAMLRGLGTEVPVRAAARIFFVGQLGKYVPGSVWPVLAQMELGASYGLSRKVIGTASLLALGIAVPVALAIGLLAVPALLSADGSAYLLLFLALPLAAVLLSPPVLNPLLDRALRLARRQPLPQRLTGATVLRVALYAAGGHLLLGLQAYLLARDLGASGALLLPLAVGAFALASSAGVLALPVPAGAGVREAVLVVSLSPVLPVGQSLLLALVSRAILTAGDLSVAGLASRTAQTSGEEKIL